MNISISLQLATQSSATGIAKLRDSLAHWQQQRGIQQWLPGEISPAQVAEQIDRNEWWVIEEGQKVLATVRIVDTDELIWPENDPQAAYVHGLMVDRSLGGEGLGREILGWAEQTIFEAQRSIVRLDCVDSNEPLCRYYAAQGYEECGVVEFGSDCSWFPVRRFEKRSSTHLAENTVGA